MICRTFALDVMTVMEINYARNELSLSLNCWFSPSKLALNADWLSHCSVFSRLFFFVYHEQSCFSCLFTFFVGLSIINAPFGFVINRIDLIRPWLFSSLLSSRLVSFSREIAVTNARSMHRFFRRKSPSSSIFQGQPTPGSVHFCFDSLIRSCNQMNEDRQLAMFTWLIGRVCCSTSFLNGLFVTKWMKTDS